MEIRRGCPKTQLEVSGHMSVERNVFPRNFCLPVSDMRLIHDSTLLAKSHSRALRRADRTITCCARTTRAGCPCAESHSSMEVYRRLPDHCWSPTAGLAQGIVGIRRSRAAFFLGRPLSMSKCDAAITAGTYALVSAGINRLLLKSPKSLLPDFKTALCMTVSPTLYAARARDQSPNRACRSRR
jgi:hypothetical protein